MKHALLMTVLLCALGAEALDRSEVVAPVIKPNEMGYIALSDCPTKAMHVSTFVYDEEDGTMRAKVYVGRSLVLWYKGFDVSGAKRSEVHYLDANFDGYIDILIGSGEARNYSVLLVWDVEEESFKKIDNEMNGELLLHPSTKSLLLRGSASWCSSFYDRYAFVGCDMVLQEQLVNISERSEFPSYGVRKAYTVVTSENRDANGYYTDVKLSTNDARQLPAYWRDIITAYDQLLQKMAEMYE